MREILFRGKTKDNGKWVEGAYYKQELFYGDKEEAMRALVINPLVGDLKTASACFDEMLEAHKDYLPQFFKEEK